jgi:hypothetical protein
VLLLAACEMCFIHVGAAAHLTTAVRNNQEILVHDRTLL